MELYGRKYTRKELFQYVGDLSQVGGLRRLEIAEGPGKGVGLVEFATGAGLNFTVLLDRGMDIPIATYKGVPLCWRSGTGDRHPAFYEPEGLAWLRMFFGGLVITCGMSTAGAPSQDGKESLGLHGRFTSLPAERVKLFEEWRGDECYLAVEGEMREAIVFGTNLLCKRRISSMLGSRKILIEDKVTNESDQRVPHMYLYHINLGFPVIDQDTRLLTPANKVTPRDEAAKPGIGEYDRMSAPIKGYAEQVFFHEMRKKKDGTTAAAMLNHGFQDGKGIGVVCRWNTDALPQFSEWKMICERTYTCGLEPANNYPLGRPNERREGRLVEMDPGQSVDYRVEIEVVEGPEELKAAREEIEGIR